jgi:hypothetical protein
VRLSPLGTTATVLPILPDGDDDDDDDDDDLWSSRCNANWQEKPKYSEKPCPSVALFTTNST